MNKLAFLALVLPFVVVRPAAAQNWDNSGNGLLKGTYNFRQVAWLVGDDAGDLSDAISAYGTITFDGNGSWSITSSSNAQFLYSANSRGGNPDPGIQNFTATGTYSISASGYGFMTSPLNVIISSITNQNPNDYIYGLVSNGIFIASSTENSTYGYNDLFIAAQQPATPPSNSSFNGSYSMMSIDFPAVNVNQAALCTRASTFQLNPNNGSAGNVQLTGYVAGRGNSTTTQNLSGINYHFSNGAVVVSFGSSYSSSACSSSRLVGGDEYLYLSSDGNFVFGGSPNGWDMVVGIKSGSGARNFSGLYYMAGVAQDDSALSSNGYVNVLSGYGAINSLSNYYLLAHQRILSIFYNNPVDYSYSDSATANSDGTFDDSYNHYVFTAGGTIGIGFAHAPSSLGIEVLVQAPEFSGSGVYINPAQIQNAGSNVPFTAQFAPGELISIYGSNLAPKPAGPDGSLPTSLGGVQVLINGQPAPIHYVSPGQINAVVPIGITSAIASVQVITDNGQSSNIVTNFVGFSQPGIFNSYTAVPALQHSDYSMVTQSSPAQVGETLQVYLTGLGTLDSSGNASNMFTAYVDGIQANVTFAGSLSSIGGGYQLNLVVPSGIHSGNVYLDISGPDSYNSEAVIPIASGTGTVSSMRKARLRTPGARPASRQLRRHADLRQK